VRFQEGIMSASKTVKQNSDTTNNANDQYVDVLYQKLGENWFAFSLIDNEMFMSPVSDDRIAEIKNDNTAVTNIRPNMDIDNEAA
jgi:hypothetical protein